MNRIKSQEITSKDKAKQLIQAKDFNLGPWSPFTSCGILHSSCPSLVPAQQGHKPQNDVVKCLATRVLLLWSHPQAPDPEAGEQSTSPLARVPACTVGAWVPQDHSAAHRCQWAAVGRCATSNTGHGYPQPPEVLTTNKVAKILEQKVLERPERYILNNPRLSGCWNLSSRPGFFSHCSEETMGLYIKLYVGEKWIFTPEATENLSLDVTTASINYFDSTSLKWNLSRETSKHPI